jgi:glutamine synthetase
MQVLLRLACRLASRPIVSNEPSWGACMANSGINAEACPGQWEFQIGPGGPYEMPDHVMVARWLLHRIGEDFGVTVSLDPTPVSEDW